MAKDCSLPHSTPGQLRPDFPIACPRCSACAFTNMHLPTLCLLSLSQSCLWLCCCAACRRLLFPYPNRVTLTLGQIYLNTTYFVAVYVAVIRPNRIASLPHRRQFPTFCLSQTSISTSLIRVLAPPRVQHSLMPQCRVSAHRLMPIAPF